eukprot:CAMPEP_0173434838 /NCGR_PEP_ID=MMETSP1357-20121228/13542_1 /TAXON_ID=77926 /ORGANISM="Hemiselmis rufescens, Strain PCC563" /LENGTH=68 /DNA_ID=CAMNT_0014399745 /DNA_START=54 /DNA_END=260 /DNA_ORIENTATION=+
MFGLLRQLAGERQPFLEQALSGLGFESLSEGDASCTKESSVGLNYGAVCYDVGGCCSAKDDQSLKTDA